MHEFKVLKDFVNPWDTPVKANPEGLVEGTFVTVKFSDANLADEKIKTVVDALIADGSIEALPSTEEVDHEVTQEDLDANPDLVAEGVKVGDVIKLPVLTDPADIAKAQAEHAAAGLVEADEVDGAEAVASVEPRKRYRGVVVLEEFDRVVGVQIFKHIKTEEGHEYDLTDSEYALEVHMSYPSQA